MGQLNVLTEYCVNSQLHGFKYLGQPDRHWTERVFWIVCICASWCGCVLMVLSSWNAFQNNAISFGTDTNYMDWNASLFSVSVCEEGFQERVYAVADELFGDKHDYNLDEVLSEITYFKGSVNFIRECFADLQCPQENLKTLSERVRTDCEDAFTGCSWMEQEFECCSYFRTLQTELGPCFSLNSHQTEKLLSYSLTTNRHTGTGFLYLELSIPSTVYVHSPEDVPNFNTITSEKMWVPLGSTVRRSYAVTDTENDAEVKNVAVQQRRCRFPAENHLSRYPLYSYSACLVECRAAAQISLCNCTSHFMPEEYSSNNTACDLNGLVCLDDYSDHLGVIVSEWADGKGLSCDCEPGCTEPEFDLVDDFSEDGEDDEIASIELSLARPSTMKYKRSVTRGRLDLVVSIGGTAGLFVGASVLSLVELIYFFTMRLFVTLQRKKKNRNSKQSNHRLPVK